MQFAPGTPSIQSASAGTREVPDPDAIHTTYNESRMALFCLMHSTNCQGPNHVGWLGIGSGDDAIKELQMESLDNNQQAAMCAMVNKILALNIALRNESAIILLAKTTPAPKKSSTSFMKSTILFWLPEGERT